MTDFVMPALGESVTEATVTRWLVAVGDVVEQGQVIVEVSTDKVDTEIESPLSGRIDALLVSEDQTVDVGTVLAAIGDGAAVAAAGGGTPVAAPGDVDAVAVSETAVVEPVVESAVESPVVEAPSAVVAPAVDVAVPATVVPLPVDLGVAAPSVPTSAPSLAAVAVPEAPVSSSRPAAYRTFLVRALAKSAGINLDAVKGTGAGGRIRRDDVLAASSRSAFAEGAAGWALIEVDTAVEGHAALVAAVTAAAASDAAVVVLEGGAGLLAELRRAPNGGAVLVVGAPEPRAVVRSGGLAIAQRAYLGLSYDAGWNGHAAELLESIGEVLRSNS